MTAYVLVEGHGEREAVVNLLSRLILDLKLQMPHFSTPFRATGIQHSEVLRRHAEAIRARKDAEALLVLRDDDDGCPSKDGPHDSDVLRKLALPFPAAVVLAYREYESLFLPCIAQMAGKPFEAPGGLQRLGIRAGTTYEGNFEIRGVKEWLSKQMGPGKIYKPSVDQLALTRLVSFSIVRDSGLAWFGTLERALAFLAKNVGVHGAVYP